MMPMSEFVYVNWLASQDRCALHNVFANLKEQAKRDVDEANHFSPWRKKHFTFAFVDDGESDTAFEVVRNAPDRSIGVDSLYVKFALNGVSIRVCRSQPQGQDDVIFHVKSEWNAKTNECYLKIDDTPCEIWQISHRALSPLINDSP